MLDKAFVQQYAEREKSEFHPLQESFNGLGYFVYKRTYARPIDGEHRTEEWYETVERVVNGASAIGANYTEAEERLLFDHIWNLRALPKGRMLWQLGTDNVERLGGDSLNNCWHVSLKTPEDFQFLFNELMLGGGMGFRVDYNSVAQFPTIKGATIEHKPTNDADFIVPDSREGWSELLRRVLEAYITGDGFSYSTILVRPAGSPIKTFGGVASGPQYLIDGVNDIRGVLDKRIDQKIRPIDALDIANIIESIVVSGNVRRSAGIAIGDPNDVDYLNAKRWDLGNIPQWRGMSNNSVMVTDIRQLPNQFWDGYNGNGEPYGLINLTNLKEYGRMGESRYDDSIRGVNPCGEIGLADYESCNLAEIILPRISGPEQLWEVSRLLYKLQKAVAALPYYHEKSEAIIHRNMRLGMSITGIAQASDEQLSWLDGNYRMLREYDIEYSHENEFPTSVRLTTVAPSGTISLLAGVTPGIHPGYSRFFVRRVRIATNDPLLEWARQRGYPIEFERNFDGSETYNKCVIEFPCEFPKDTILTEDMTAIRQLDLVRQIQREWADNSVSVTVYYRPEELDEIKEYLKEYWDEFKTVSFLLHSEHGFDQAPYEEIDEYEYTTRLNQVTGSRFASGISSIDLDDAACASGACPIR